MAKKSERKNRTARRRLQLREELEKRNEARKAQLDKDMKVIFGCLAVTLALLDGVLIFVLA